MLQITNYRQGAVLNHNHGTETEHSLKIRVEGISSMGFPVMVNNRPAAMNGRQFFADVELTQEVNQITASALTPYGKYSQELTLVWDKKSFKRCNFCLDDHIFTFMDLTKQRPKRAFDHFYLKWLKRLHTEYGLKMTLNCFYHNDHEEFTLNQMPDIWKSEFIDNSDWLRFAFHAYSEFPDRPYAEASAEQIGKDWDLVQNEIIRFAGEESYINPVVLHWANVHPAAAQEAIRRGVRCYHRTFRLRVMGGPSLEDRQRGGDMNTIEARSMTGEDRMVASSEGLAMHYGFQEEFDFLAKNGVYYDSALGVYFIHVAAISNLLPLAEYPSHYNAIISHNAENGIEVMETGGHEQYSFPYYSNYEPDHLQRLEAAIRLMTEGGYQPVFFAEGRMGNLA